MNTPSVDVAAIQRKALAAANKAHKAAADRMSPKNKLKMPEPTGDAEVDSHAELSALQSGFRERAKQEEKRYNAATELGYYTCVVFQSKLQRDKFLEALNLLEYGVDFVDGRRLAEAVGVKLPAAEAHFTPSPKIDKTWAALVMEQKNA